MRGNEARRRHPASTRRLLGLVGVGVCAMSGAFTGRALAQEVDVTIVVIPESVALAQGQAADVEVIVRNPGTANVRDVVLTSFPTRGVKVTTNEPTLPRLGAGEVHVFSVEIDQSKRGGLPGSVAFKVSYRVAGEDGTRFASASLKVEMAAVESSASVAKLEIKTTLASLSEQRPGKLYLLVTNTTNVSITVNGTATLKPKFVYLNRVHPGALALKPGATRVISYDVTAAGALQPGKHLVVIIATLSWERGGEQLRGSLVTSQEVSVEVFGESAILGLIAVPALLLLPGGLIVLTFALGLKWLWKRDKLPADPKEATFWLIAVPISFLIAAVYPLLGGQNYLLAYGFGDLIWLWVISSAIGGVAFLIWWGSGALVRFLTVPKEGDRPLNVLKKLAHRRSRVYRRRVFVEQDGTKPAAFLLQRTIKSGVGQWIGPRILIHFAPDSPLRNQVEAHLNRDGRIKDVYEIVKDAPPNQVVLSFDPASAFRAPKLVEKAAFEGRDDLLVIPRTGIG